MLYNVHFNEFARVTENSRYNTDLLSLKLTKDTLLNCAKGQTLGKAGKNAKKLFTKSVSGGKIYS